MMSSPRWLLMIVALASTIAVAPPVSAQPAAAQPAEGATDDPRAASRAHFMAGVEHLQQGRAAEAIEDLEAARALYSTAPVHFNLGLAYREVGRFRDAISALTRFVSAAGDGISAERSAEVDRYLRSLRASLGIVRIVATPDDATIALAGEPVGRGRVRLELDPGTYPVTVTADDHIEVDREVVVAPGGDETVRVQLEPTNRAGVLDLDVTPEETTVSIDGRVRGIGDVSLELASGAHRLLLEVDDARREHDFEITAGERLALALTVDSGDDFTWLWVTLAILVAGGAAAAVSYFVLNPSEQDPLPGNLGMVTTALGAR